MNDHEAEQALFGAEEAARALRKAIQELEAKMISMYRIAANVAFQFKAAKATYNATLDFKPGAGLEVEYKREGRPAERRRLLDTPLHVRVAAYKEINALVDALESAMESDIK